MVNLITRAINALSGDSRRRRKASAPKSSDHIPIETDELIEVFTSDLTPRLALTILREAAYGDVARQNAVIDTMLDRDGHLRGVWGTRLRALTGLKWKLVPANPERNPRVNEAQAKSALEYCGEVVGDIDGFESVVCHLPEAIGRGTAVAQLRWENSEPVAAETIDFPAVAGNNRNKRSLRVLTDASSTGIVIDDFPAGAFIAHTPESIGGGRFRGGLLRAAILNYLGKRWGERWWLTCIELFGMPTTIAKYPDDADSKTRSELIKMIRSVGVNRGGIFPVGSEVELIEYAKGGKEWPYERLIDYYNAELSKEFLGQTLTTQMDESGGSRAAAQVHDSVRDDLRDDDLRREAATFRSQLLIPLTIYKFGPDAQRNAPHFERIVDEDADLKSEGELISLSVNDLGARVKASVVEDRLNIPLASKEDRDEILPGRSSGVGSAFGLNERSCCAEHAHVANRALSRIVERRRTAISKTASWIFAAVLASAAHTRNVIAEVESFVSSQGSLDRAMQNLPSVFERLPTEELVDLQTHLNNAAQLAGRDYVRTRIARAASTRNKARSAMRRAGLVKVSNEDIDFNAIEFVEAIDALRERVLLSPAQFELLDTESRSLAWRVAGVWDMRLLSQIHNELAESIAAGETTRDFRLRLPQMTDRNGWTGENPWHADLVQFQNFVTSTAAGRYRQYDDFGVEYWRFVANGESCPICSPVIGKVFPMSDRRFFAPLHFWCDCEDEAVFEGEIDPREVVASQTVDNPAFDAERANPRGFQWDVATYGRIRPLHLGFAPEFLRPVFRAAAQERGWRVIE